MGQGRYRRLVLVGAAGIQPREGEIFDQFLVSHEDYVKAGFHDEANYHAQYGDLASVDQLVEWDICREMTTRVGWKPYMFNRALPELLRSVRVPTLLVWGSDDRIVPPVCGQQYVEALPKAQLITLDNAGHYVEMEQPDELARLVREHAKSV
jgi:pimeloyl-ACP methyl ester carboxylesterase